MLEERAISFIKNLGMLPPSQSVVIALQNRVSYLDVSESLGKN